MGLAQNMTVNGVPVANAYIKITQVSGVKKTLTAELAYFSARGAELAFGGSTFSFPYDLTSAKNIYQQAYEYALTLPSFTGATVVLEAGQTA